MPREYILLHAPSPEGHAAQDKIFTYEEHQELAASIPDARLAVVQNSGHMSPMEQPQAVTELLRQWLKSACERLS